ncbi:hypothetical protein [uncultured Kocuria sp.]|uniref:hypothetical protein n=1 Tax=uncultured Kocuria sp. TaxID=259305 RepID=UPI0025DD8607|nr:hypothetical protein [uncultured Kocuria sp.]
MSDWTSPGGGEVTIVDSGYTESAGQEERLQAVETALAEMARALRAFAGEDGGTRA